MYESDGGKRDHRGSRPPRGAAWTAERDPRWIRPARHMAGEFTFLHMMAIDSKGNLYVGETVGGRRVQKFINCGRRLARL